GVRAVAGARGPGLPAPGIGVADLVALEGGRCEAAAEVILLPPLGAPPVDGVAIDVLKVADDEGAALRELNGPGDRDGVGVDAAGEVADRRAQRIGAELAAAVAER